MNMKSPKKIFTTSEINLLEAAKSLRAVAIYEQAAGLVSSLSDIERVVASGEYKGTPAQALKDDKFAEAMTAFVERMRGPAQQIAVYATNVFSTYKELTEFFGDSAIFVPGTSSGKNNAEGDNQKDLFCILHDFAVHVRRAFSELNNANQGAGIVALKIRARLKQDKRRSSSCIGLVDKGPSTSTMSLVEAIPISSRRRESFSIASRQQEDRMSRESESDKDAVSESSESAEDNGGDTLEEFAVPPGRNTLTRLEVPDELLSGRWKETPSGETASGKEEKKETASGKEEKKNHSLTPEARVPAKKHSFTPEARVSPKPKQIPRHQPGSKTTVSGPSKRFLERQKEGLGSRRRVRDEVAATSEKRNPKVEASHSPDGTSVDVFFEKNEETDLAREKKEKKSEPKVAREEKEKKREAEMRVKIAAAKAAKAKREAARTGKVAKETISVPRKNSASDYGLASGPPARSPLSAPGSARRSSSFREVLNDDDAFGIGEEEAFSLEAKKLEGMNAISGSVKTGKSPVFSEFGTDNSIRRAASKMEPKESAAKKEKKEKKRRRELLEGNPKPKKSKSIKSRKERSLGEEVDFNRQSTRERDGMRGLLFAEEEEKVFPPREGFSCESPEDYKTARSLLEPARQTGTHHFRVKALPLPREREREYLL